MSRFLEALPWGFDPPPRWGRQIPEPAGSSAQWGNRRWEGTSREPLDTEYAHHGMPSLGHSPSPHGSRALPEEPRAHVCPGPTAATSLGSLHLGPSHSLSLITGCFSQPQSHSLSGEEDDINNHTDPTTPIPLSFPWYRPNAPLRWQNDSLQYTDEKLRLSGENDLSEVVQLACGGLSPRQPGLYLMLSSGALMCLLSPPWLGSAAAVGNWDMTPYELWAITQAHTDNSGSSEESYMGLYLEMVKMEEKVMWLKGTNPQVPSSLGAEESCGFMVHGAAQSSSGDASDPACLLCPVSNFLVYPPPSPGGLPEPPDSSEPVLDSEPGASCVAAEGFTGPQFPCIGHSWCSCPHGEQKTSQASLWPCVRALESEDSDGNGGCALSCQLCDCGQVTPSL